MEEGCVCWIFVVLISKYIYLHVSLFRFRCNQVWVSEAASLLKMIFIGLGPTFLPSDPTISNPLFYFPRQSKIFSSHHFMFPYFHYSTNASKLSNTHSFINWTPCMWMHSPFISNTLFILLEEKIVRTYQTPFFSYLSHHYQWKQYIVATSFLLLQLTIYYIRHSIMSRFKYFNLVKKSNSIKR